ncbi:MAG: N-acyl-D-glutamate deacylase, partial [Steroidobacteraceae bacterium]
MQHDWDVLIRGARVFDGTGAPASIEDVAVHDGRIAARGANLAPERAERVVDARGRWLLPGLLDIHTHLDLEVELSPGLPESVRHGTTTVVVGNCSLGTAFGAQRRNGDDPILDCFTRVENMPKSVLRQVVDRIDWHSTGEYLAHLD